MTEPLTVESATIRDLAEMGPLKDGALAASAIALAREIDCAGNSATSKSMCARALLDVMDRLRELAPPKREADKVADINDERDKRRAAATG